MSQQSYRKERTLDTLIALGLAFLTALLYLPFLGSYPLWDPWEAHYSQVAMEMIYNNTWWETWYRNATNSFWSKPILTFWLMVGSLKTFRIAQIGDFAQAEFFLRMPIALMGSLGVAYIYYFVRRLWNRRTGIIVALVLATCPQYFLISRQVMVDIPYVVVQLMAMGFFALGLFNLRPQDDAQEQRWGVRTFSLLAIGALIIQLIEVTFWHVWLMPPSATWSGCLGRWATSWSQSNLIWSAFAIGFALWALVRAYVHNPQTRAFYLFFFFSGLGFLAKGLLSIVLPAGVVIFYILVTRDWDVLKRMRLFHDSPRLSPATSVILGTLGSLLAVWFITYPMMPALTAEIIRDNDRQLAVFKRQATQTRDQVNQIKKLRAEGKTTASLFQAQSQRFITQFQAELFQFQSNALKHIQQFYNHFRNKLNLPQQIASFVIFLLYVLIFFMLVAGNSRWHGFKLIFFGSVAVLLLSNYFPLQKYFENYTLIAVIITFIVSSTLVTLSARQPDWQGSMPYYIASMGFLVIELISKFMPFGVMTSGQHSILPVGLAFLLVFTAVFAVLCGLTNFLNGQFDKQLFNDKKWPVFALYLTGVLIWLFYALHQGRAQILGHQIHWQLLALLSMAVMLWIYHSENSREHLKAMLLPGVVIYLIAAGSWTFYMNYKHGLPFMKEWFIYHHFERIRGVIEKPNYSFDIYIKQIGFGMFPWAAFLPLALIRFMRWNWKDLALPQYRRNIFFFCCFFFPFFFYTFSSTKFHHYIFPVVPFLAIIVGVWISSLFREDGISKERMGVAASFLLFVLLAKDLLTDYKPLHQLFTYYTERQTPGDVYPRGFFLGVFALFGLIFLTVIFVRRLRYYHFGLLMIPVALFVLFVNVKIIPAVAPNFSFKDLYTAYQKQVDECTNRYVAKHFQTSNEWVWGPSQQDIEHLYRTTQHECKLPFGEYSNWDERSTSYYTNNFSKYLGRQDTARPFLQQNRPVYIMVSRHQIPALRTIAKSVGKRLYIVDRAHYDMWLVSTRQPEGARGIESVRLSTMPDLPAPHWRRVNIDFDGKATLIAVRVDKPQGYKRGDQVEVRFLFKVTGKFTRNWRVFIHADPVQWTRHRLNWDHEMAEGLYPTSEWKQGEYVQNILIRTIPRSYPEHYTRLNLYMGLWLGAARVPVKSSSVYHDGMDRVLPITLRLLP
jgi:4-amino-4-deoxy-L-arabinose transferase-like glycosyltransferase